MNRITSAFAAASCSLVLMFAAAPEAAAQTENVTTYRDWAVTCQTRPDTGTTECEMSQIIYADAAQTQRALMVVVGYAQPNSDPGMLLFLPLGISLPPGVFLQIDQGEPQAVPVERCENDGCVVQLILSPAYLDVLKAGSQATVHAHDRQRRRFTIPVSLLGFTAGLNALSGS